MQHNFIQDDAKRQHILSSSWYLRVNTLNYFYDYRACWQNLVIWTCKCSYLKLKSFIWIQLVFIKWFKKNSGVCFNCINLIVDWLHQINHRRYCYGNGTKVDVLFLQKFRLEAANLFSTDHRRGCLPNKGITSSFWI